jgi:hypothetical protein
MRPAGGMALMDLDRKRKNHAREVCSIQSRDTAFTKTILDGGPTIPLTCGMDTAPLGSFFAVLMPGSSPNQARGQLDSGRDPIFGAIPATEKV